MLASSYYLGVGTAPGSANIFSRNVGLATSQNVTGIPLGSGAIYVTLGLMEGPTPFSHWIYQNYTYATVGSAAVMVNPTPGSTIPGPIWAPSVCFEWTTGSGATDYWLMVGTSPGGGDIWNAGTLNTFAWVGLPANTGVFYVRLYTLIGAQSNGGVWVWNDYYYYVYNP
jgi:hypothetical protein